MVIQSATRVPGASRGFAAEFGRTAARWRAAQRNSPRRRVFLRVCHLTTSRPFMPAWKWPEKVQR